MASRHYIEFELLDFSEGKSSFTVQFGALTALSLPGFLTQLGALRTALDGITLGTISRERWIGDETPLSNIPPLDSSAQVELTWLVRFVGNLTAQQGSVSIATPDLSLLSAQFKDHIDYSDPDVAAFITAFETIARMPNNDAETVTIETIVLMGRNR